MSFERGWVCSDGEHRGFVTSYKYETHGSKEVTKVIARDLVVKEIDRISSNLEKFRKEISEIEPSSLGELFYDSADFKEGMKRGLNNALSALDGVKEFVLGEDSFQAKLEKTMEFHKEANT